MANMQAVAEAFKAQGAAVEVADGAALSAALANLLSDHAKRIAMGRLALEAAANGDGAMQRNYALAARYLSDSLVSATPVG
jgi:3-deoxy-D-manno-octulosonic-acid transferase